MAVHTSSVGPWLNVYVDESGTAELDLRKPNVGRYYVGVAVFVDEEQDQKAQSLLDGIAGRLCGGAEIKSARIGVDHDRRLRFLEAIQHVDFGYLALAVDKSLVLADSGLRFTTTFHKFFSRLLQGQFGYSGGGLKVCSDRFGDSLFMENLDSYLKETVKPHLFYGYEHRSVPSDSCRLIQLADLVAGSLAYWLDPARASLYSERFRDMLITKEAGIVAWPLPSRAQRGPASSSLDGRIEEAAIGRAKQLLRVLNESSEVKDRMRALTLDALLFARIFESGPRRSIFTDRLLDHLAAHGLDVPPKQAFRAEVIGGLRDRGIVIAGTNEGYRLAISVEDISDYLAHTGGVVEPMLARVVSARTAVKQDTSNQHDILEEGDDVLREVVTAFTAAQVLPQVQPGAESDYAFSEEAEDAES